MPITIPDRRLAYQIGFWFVEAYTQDDKPVYDVVRRSGRLFRYRAKSLIAAVKVADSLHCNAAQ